VASNRTVVELQALRETMVYCQQYLDQLLQAPLIASGGCSATSASASASALGPVSTSGAPSALSPSLSAISPSSSSSLSSSSSSDGYANSLGTALDTVQRQYEHDEQERNHRRFSGPQLKREYTMADEAMTMLDLSEMRPRTGSHHNSESTLPPVTSLFAMVDQQTPGYTFHQVHHQQQLQQAQQQQQQQQQAQQQLMGRIVPSSSCGWLNGTVTVPLRSSASDGALVSQIRHDASERAKRSARVCVACNATSTPRWRRGPLGPQT
jgi:hypothetical protein